LDCGDPAPLWITSENWITTPFAVVGINEVLWICRDKIKRRRVAAVQSQAGAPDKEQVSYISHPALPGKCPAYHKVDLITNRNLKASKDCEFRLCRDGPDEAGATKVATELIRHVAGMAKTQPLRGKALLSLFGNVSVPRYPYRASVAIPK